ncbi:MAG: 3-isopropylmalate dehydratase large subunit [Gammaproteobacteria bacterium]|jgi:3-isopropylmalate/(R)-2-methylmalate dehydratase large subunit|nr:3-isopropylmalate dehydratase large subunit [Gammaproteobacteria bacterium]MBT4461861.1 3-isopropylmalate dehydratase large subunit [Gammaproteobacteria bacterium]MBT4654250.1 3-isopropylmalate dehydratase large subunit [Gammaproteobacteria bacterium]MBT5116778.1 3-isopropylmalate dehydratase large subunit [Gammaproteobacteria bacterium]MBT5761155.1 3-isopropylmalate dehydratase large subunit [Gammaproteobacteria bacterium]
MKKTLYDKIWDEHLVHENEDGSSLIYIDRHLVHEVTSPQAFDGLDIQKRDIWNNNSIYAVSDHNVPTQNRASGIDDEISKLQVDTLIDNCKKHKISYFDLNNINQGIVHVIGPELAITQPGMTLVCGDSHTSTHGALASLAFGIGTSDVEHVLATQCININKEKNFRINITNNLSSHVSSKDLILHIIKIIGTSGGTGYTIEFTGDCIENMSIESRMTICNMSIEAGAKSGLVAFDSKTHDYMLNKKYSPNKKYLNDAIKYWENLVSDSDAVFDKTLSFDATDVLPQVTWGTSPEMTTDINGKVPNPDDENDSSKKQYMQRALDYMGLKANQDINSIMLDKIFIGSCTNSRIEDLRQAAKIVEGYKVSDKIKQAIVVPGSGHVKAAAEKEGLDKIFVKSGFEWREPGCSMCLGMNNDSLLPYERCASTSNRNFEGRQGDKGRTHLVSPSMAALAAIKGHFSNVIDFVNEK